MFSVQFTEAANEACGNEQEQILISVHRVPWTLVDIRGVSGGALGKCPLPTAQRRALATDDPPGRATRRATS